MAYSAEILTRLEPRHRDALATLARLNHRSVSAEARLAILGHLERERKRPADDAAEGEQLKVF